MARFLYAYCLGAGQMGTDLNRDIIWELLKQHGIRPVRMVGIDDTWSVMRFRPA